MSNLPGIEVKMMLGLLLIAFAAVGAQVPSGTWRNSTLTLTLRVAGDTLTGSVTDGPAAPHTIKEGMVRGSELRFTTDAVLNDKDIVLDWEGALDGDRLTLMRWIAGMPRSNQYRPFNGPFVLRRTN